MTLASPSLWLAQEQLRLQSDSPRTWARLQTTLRYRVPILALVAGLVGGFAQQHTLGTSDTVLFTNASRQLLSSHGLDVFSNPALQVGPLYLLALGLLSLLAKALFLPAAFVAGFAQAALVAWLCLYLVRSFAADNGARRALRDVGIGTSLIFGPLAAVGVAGHFEEPLIAAFLLLAADRAAKGRDVSAALWLVLASGFKLWGFLGVAILLLNGSPRRWLRRGAVYAAGCVLCYLPFFLWGTVQTFHFSWLVWPSATLGYFMAGDTFTFGLRIAQSAMVCLFVSALALRRSTPAWALPVMVIAVRLIFDPQQIPYYWVPLLICLSIAAWALVERRVGGLWLLTSVGAFVIITLPNFTSVPVVRAVHTVVLIALVGGLFLLPRHRAAATT